MCELPCFGCGGEKSRSPWKGGFGEQQSVVDWSWVSTFNDVVRAMGWRGRARCGVECPLLLILAPSFFPDAPARHPLQHPSASVYSPVTSSSAMPGVQIWSRDPGLNWVFHSSSCSGHVPLPLPTTLPQREGTSKQGPCGSSAAPRANTEVDHAWLHMQLSAHPCAQTLHLRSQVPGESSSSLFCS